MFSDLKFVLRKPFIVSLSFLVLCACAAAGDKLAEKEDVPALSVREPITQLAFASVNDPLLQVKESSKVSDRVKFQESSDISYAQDAALIEAASGASE